jgi:arsenate reductase
MIRPVRLSLMVAVPLIAVVLLVAVTRLRRDHDDDRGAAAEIRTATVLFLCPHGAAKSVLASAYFKQLAAERGLRVRVEAAGTEPAPVVSSAVAARLEQQGLAVPITKPRLVTAADVADADVVISIGCDTSKIPQTDKLRRWDDVPDTSADFAAADQAIHAKAQALVEELSHLRDARRD